MTWFKPLSIQQLFNIRCQYPESKIVAGNTEVGIHMKLKRTRYPVIISVVDVKELNSTETLNIGIKIGASVCLTNIEKFLKETMKNLPDSKCKSFSALVDMFQWFGGKQVRNYASVGGNILTEKGISDLNPIFMVAGCELEVADVDGVHRVLDISNNFFMDHQKTAMKTTETLLSITIPFTKSTEYFRAYKQTRRRNVDVAIVNAAFRVDLRDGVVQDCSMAFGGIAPITKMAKETSRNLVGRFWDQTLLDYALDALGSEMGLQTDANAEMLEYKISLVLSFFLKFFLFVKEENPTLDSKTSDRLATNPFTRESTRGTQMFQEVRDQSTIDAVGRPIIHSSAYKHATGEAIYVDDTLLFKDELYMSIVFSKRAHAKIVSIDASEALSVPGVHAFIDHNDVSGSNLIGPFVKDEELFTKELVTCVGQYIGAVVATDKATAQKAASLVHIEYQELEPIISIEDAVAKSSFYEPIRTLEKGDVNEGFNISDEIIEGEMKVGEQEHFYMETQSAFAMPKEDGGMEIISATNHISFIQATVAEVLNVHRNKIKVRVKRVGGSFGGKETRNCNLAAALAIAAKRVGRPVRCSLDRDEDMISTGTRHAFLGRYKVGFTKDGRIQALQINMFNNAGNTTDLSVAIMERAMFQVENAYQIPNISATGSCCKTNIPSNTAFRGYGSPQAAMIAENWIFDVALACGISQNQVREINLYQEGDSTYYNQKLNDARLLNRCWSECLRKSDYELRLKKVEEFNRSNRWKKRGLSTIPLVHINGFSERFLNQAGAFVIIYTDGSVLLTHGGVEFGQGLYTKMIQVASRILKIPIEKIHTDETSTNTVPNTSPTAASVSSDLNGMAIKNACEELYKRLEPYRTKEPNNTWEDWVSSAYFDRVCLYAAGFYKKPDVGFDWISKTGFSGYYFSYGTAVSEVEIDCLTGDHVVLRTDIVMDVGDSINPAIDIGQIEGAFIQGYGLFTLEEHRWSPDGNLLTKGPGTYKIPSITDIPVEFNVSLLDGVPNSQAICSSKAIGEPPLSLASSVFFAIKEAIMSARRDSDINDTFRLDSPATAERIRMACVDSITKSCQGHKSSSTPSFIRS